MIDINTAAKITERKRKKCKKIIQKRLSKIFKIFK